jgi:tetratricopeptide (TPR) repeat protein
MIVAVVLIVFVLVVLALLGAWLLFGSGPRRRRAVHALQRRLEQEGDWTGVLSEAQALLAEQSLPPQWRERVRKLAADCEGQASDASIKARRYEDGLAHGYKAAEYGGRPADQVKQRVVETMLAEVRRLFGAVSNEIENAAVLELLSRLFRIEAYCPEASFWLGLTLVRQGQYDPALAHLNAAHEQAGKQYVDPALYIGILLHRLGKPQDGLRYLAEANRLAPRCPFVPWQMGISLVASGGDPGLAQRALQKAVGPQGLGIWLATPDRVWVEAFPDGASYVRRLAGKYPYVDPLLGRDLNVIIRQGQLALAQALYRQGNFQEAADQYARLMQDVPPTLLLVKGLGLSLARLQRYDQAYKHLRAAMELEEGKDPLTAGYLALCGAMGRPTQEADRPKNITWAIRLLARYQVQGNPEWAGLVSAVHAEARSVGMSVAVEDQLHLCQALASCHAADPQAAAAYAHLAAAHPDAVLPIHAWLYSRAASANASVKSDRDLDLFARTFRDTATARHYFASQKWDFDNVEYTYLERSAALAPGRFPEALGPDYPRQGEAFLLARSKAEEDAGKKDQALASVEVLVKLAPHNAAGVDRLACLHYRRGDLDRATALLQDLQRLAPADHWPLVRQAVIEEQRGQSERRAAAIDRALGLTNGSQRAAVAYLGARLALREGIKQWDRDGSVFPTTHPALEQGQSLLQQCLRDDPDHVDALWVLAALRSARGDRDGLAEQAPRMDRPEVKDGRFHYLGAVCNLAARNYTQALELSKRSSTDESLAAESHFLMALAHLHLENATAATQSLLKAAGADKSPSAPQARALLGRICFGRSAYDEAVRWWNGLDATKRDEWKLAEPLRQTVLLSALTAFQKGRYEQAAERFREASKLGLRDKRLGPMLTLSLVKAGQRLLYEKTNNGQ